MAANSRLHRYREKRDAGRTPEPFGSETRSPRGAAGGVFVVQKHAARRLHYDFRLELNGALESWAIPRGPSLDPGEKRLAVHVEPHPIEYGDFEGVIPAGNYGAGAVILWDRGRWEPVEDPVAGLENGKLLFDLHGYKLRGRWQLVRTNRKASSAPGDEKGSGEWLLIKKPDGFADPEGERVPPEESVLSGLSIEEMREGASRAAELAAEVAKLGAPRKRVDAAKLSPMLATLIDEPFSDPGWVFELKYDGYRVLAEKDDGKVVLRYRSGLDATALYPEVVAALAALPHTSFIVDGELAVLDDDGRPRFERLQQRGALGRERDVRRTAALHPVTLAGFDLPAYGGFDLRGLPLADRKRILRRVLPAAGPLRYVDHIEERGQELYEAVSHMQLEGIIGKRADSAYVSKRTEDWVKIKVVRRACFAIIGYTAPKGARIGLGSVHLAVRDGKRWRYVGRAGSGLSERELKDLYAELSALPRWTPDTVNEVPAGKEHTWIEPRLACEVDYGDVTDIGQLRHPRFAGLRRDLKPEECLPPPDLAGSEPPAPRELAPEGKTLNLTNLDKVFWPAEGSHPAYTKGDLIEFYRVIAPWLVPYLRDRPVVLTRYPDGIHGKNFFQKDAPSWVPDWIRTEVMWSEHRDNEIRYFIADDERAVVFLANLGTIPLHIWSSRLATLAQPDWSIIDLDPKGAPFSHVVACARHIRELCEEIELPSYIKTSGSTGLHVLVPMGRQCTYEQSRDLALLIARVIESEHADLCTTARAIRRREGRVYLDCFQNGHGKLLVSPYSVRPLPGAPVSAPLRWTEVNARLELGKFTIKTMPARMDKLGEDPVVQVLDDRPDLPAALERLAARLAGGKPKPKRRRR